jgi:hypothetical protein
MGTVTSRFLALLNVTGENATDEVDAEKGKPYSSSVQCHHSHHSFVVG